MERLCADCVALVLRGISYSIFDGLNIIHWRRVPSDIAYGLSDGMHLTVLLPRLFVSVNL